MPRPKPAVKPVQVLLRLHPDTVGALDIFRAEQSRSAFVSDLIGLLGDGRTGNAPLQAIFSTTLMPQKTAVEAPSRSKRPRLAPSPLNVATKAKKRAAD